MPSGNLFSPDPDPIALFGEAQQVFGKKTLAARLDVDRRTINRWEKAPEKLPLARQLALREILRSIPRQTEGTDFTFIDLFAGIGGMRAGFAAAQGRCIFTSEWNPWAQKTYTANYGTDEPLIGDITQD
jgi:DNA (cytosine-5)-methyltransferase 1